MARKKAKPAPPPAPKLTGIDRVGEIAGEVWHFLDKQGNSSLTQVSKEIDAPRDQVMLAIGWLAREGKVDIQENGRSKSVGLI